MQVKQLVVETHKSIFIPIILLVQISLVTVVNWTMG